MANKNWYMEAYTSKNPEIKALLKKYNELDANAADYESQKAALVANIKERLDSIKPEQIIDETPKAEPEADNNTNEVIDAESGDDADEVDLDKQPEPETDPEEPEVVFGYTEEDAAKAKSLDYLIELKKASREEVARLEKTRLKHATYKQNRELDAKIWKVRRIIGIALKRELALKERERRIRNAGRISSVALKRARFVKLMRQGISITNITKHPEGVKKEELVEVLNAETIEACKKNNSRFPDMWERWKAKFLDNKDEKKQ